MALNDRDRRALVLGGVGAGIVLAYLFVLEPAVGMYNGLVAEHDHLARQVARVARDTQQAAYYEKEIAQYESQHGPLGESQPFDKQLSLVGEQLIGAAQQSGLNLRGATPTAGPPWGDDPSLQLALFRIDAEVQWPNAQMAGQTWENVFKFIALAYRIPGVLSVERLDLSGDAPPGGGDPRKPGKLTVQVTFSVLAQATEEGGGLWTR